MEIKESTIKRAELFTDADKADGETIATINVNLKRSSELKSIHLEDGRLKIVIETVIKDD